MTNAVISQNGRCTLGYRAMFLAEKFKTRLGTSNTNHV